MRWINGTITGLAAMTGTIASPRFAGIRRHHKYLAVTAAAGLSLAGLSLAVAAPASAAPCNGFTCAGHDPATTGCNQYPSTFKQTSGPLLTITNWYSEGCNANWAQASLSPGASLTNRVQRLLPGHRARLHGHGRRDERDIRGRGRI